MNILKLASKNEKTVRKTTISWTSSFHYIFPIENDLMLHTNKGNIFLNDALAKTVKTVYSQSSSRDCRNIYNSEIDESLLSNIFKINYVAHREKNEIRPTLMFSKLMSASTKNKIIEEYIELNRKGYSYNYRPICIDAFEPTLNK